MKVKVIVVFALVGILITSTFVMAPEADVTVWVEAALGISIDGKNSVDCYKGEECGAWLTIKNDGNIRDKLKLTAEVQPSSENHILYDFECAETIGECGNKTVDNMILTPSTDKTQVYLYIMPMGSKNVVDPNAKIEVFGWSQTDKKYNDLKTVNIDMKTKSYFTNPLEAPGLRTVSLIVLFFLSTSVFGILRYRK